MLRIALCAAFILAADVSTSLHADAPPAEKVDIRIEFDGKLCRASFANMNATAQNIELKAGLADKSVVLLSKDVQIHHGNSVISAEQAEYDFSKRTLTVTGKANFQREQNRIEASGAADLDNRRQDRPHAAAKAWSHGVYADRLSRLPDAVSVFTGADSVVQTVAKSGIPIGCVTEGITILAATLAIPMS